MNIYENENLWKKNIDENKFTLVTRQIFHL